MDKAKKEIALNKKHRGLLKIEPNIEEAKKHIEKAEHNLKAAISLQKNGFADWSVSACFYSIYHCFLSIITKQGYESRNQECTISLIRVLKKDKKTDMAEDIIESLDIEENETKQESNIISMRENFQYGTDLSIKDEKIEKLKEICRKAIEQTKKEIY